MSQYTGELAALGAAMLWAVGSILFGYLPMPAAAINLFRNCLSSILLLGALVVLALVNGDSLLHADAAAWGWLAVSGVVGIGIGDNCYFRSLQILGARRGPILMTLSPPMAALFGWWLLSETLPVGIWIGMVVTLAGIVWVILERGHEKEAAGHYPGSLRAGVVNGFLGALCQALGAVFSKLGMTNLDSLEATFIRALAAVAFGAVTAIAGRKLAGWIHALRPAPVFTRFAVATVCGTTLGIWLSLVSVKHTKIGVAQTLLSLTTVFVVPLVWIFLRQRVSPRAIVGALLAVAGVAILFCLKS